MSVPVIFRPEAEQDVRDAAAWYDALPHPLGDELRTEMDRVIALVAQFPDSFSTVGRLRRAGLDRFPYGVFYRTRSTYTEVVAVTHNSRDPGAPQRRA